MFAGNLEITGDHRQQIVEIVGDAAGQLSQRLHLLRLAQLLLEQLALGDVAQDHQQLVRPAPLDRRDRGLDIGGRAVESQQPRLDPRTRPSRPDDLREFVLDALAVGRMQAIQHRAADDLLEGRRPSMRRQRHWQTARRRRDGREWPRECSRRGEAATIRLSPFPCGAGAHHVVLPTWRLPSSRIVRPRRRDAGTAEWKLESTNKL
jgi:hypothetical protein